MKTKRFDIWGTELKNEEIDERHKIKLSTPFQI